MATTKVTPTPGKKPNTVRVQGLTYTVTGQPNPRSVKSQEYELPYDLLEVGDVVLDIECVKVHPPKGWPQKRKRFSVVVVGIGHQLGPGQFGLTQWWCDTERYLINAIRPALAAARRVFIEARGDFDTKVLAGTWKLPKDAQGNLRTPTWATAVIDKHKVVNIRKLVRRQKIGKQVERHGDIKGKDVLKIWDHPRRKVKERPKVLRHNFFDVLETSMKVSKIKWPVDKRNLVKVKLTKDEVKWLTHYLINPETTEQNDVLRLGILERLQPHWPNPTKGKSDDGKV